MEVVSLSGRLDTNTALEADRVLRRIITAGETQVVLDLQNLEYICSSGLRILLSSMRNLKKRNGDLKLASLRPQVKEIIHMAGFDRIFSIYASEPEATASFSFAAPDEHEQRILDALSSTLDIEEERRRIEGSLQQSETMYRAIFENSGTAMAIVEDDLTIFLANAEFEKMVAHPVRELAEVESLLTFVVRNDLGLVTEFHDLARKNTEKVPLHFEFRLKDRVGTIRSVYVIVDMIPGTPRRVYSLLDITELRKIEEDLRHELTRKREFIILSAHELRTPLQPVMGYLNLLIDDRELYGINTEARDILKRCSENLDLVKETIDHIVRLNGLGYGPEQMLPRCRPQYREVSPRQLLTSYSTVIRCDNNITVDISIPGDLKIQTDSEYFTLIVQSLAFNLIRYSGSRGRIEISYREEKSGHLFTIKNSSTVLAQEIIPHLFTPYYVGEESKLLEKSGSIGLSLPIAKQMAEMLGGTVTVSSSPETGTLFILRLPKYVGVR